MQKAPPGAFSFLALFVAYIGYPHQNKKSMLFRFQRFIYIFMNIFRETP